MKKSYCLVLLMLTTVLVVWSQENNDFYDNTVEKTLSGSLKMEVTGEISNPGLVDLRKLPHRSVITRETRLQNGKLEFIGAYRYDGYSLFDIIKEKYIAKKNKAEFGSVIDLLVQVENGNGEKVVLSWGEVYYPTALHRILIADRVAPIIPSESKDQWPMPEKVKLVCGNDMITERNIDGPVKITVFSAPRSFPMAKGMRPLYSPHFRLLLEGKEQEFFVLDAEKRVYPTVFYGRGKGFHGIQYFNGVLFRDVFKELIFRDADSMRRGYFIIVAVDGYRIAVTCSELFNRNDHAEFLLIDRGVDQDGGRFSLYPACDFFSDRAVKALHIIYYQKI